MLLVAPEPCRPESFIAKFRSTVKLRFPSRFPWFPRKETEWKPRCTASESGWQQLSRCTVMLPLLSTTICRCCVLACIFLMHMCSAHDTGFPQLHFVATHTDVILGSHQLHVAGHHTNYCMFHSPIYNHDSIQSLLLCATEPTQNDLVSSMSVCFSSSTLCLLCPLGKL